VDSEVCTLSQARAAQLIETEQLHAALTDMHRDVVEHTTAARQRRVQSHNRRTSVQPVNFTVGDFVLIARLIRPAKTQLEWLGPMRVVATPSDQVVEVEDLSTRHRHTLHSTRVKFYADKNLHLTTDITDHAQHVANAEWDVKAITNIRKTRTGEFELLVNWLGFEDVEATYEPLNSMHESVPEMVRNFLTDASQPAAQLRQAALDTL